MEKILSAHGLDDDAARRSPQPFRPASLAGNALYGIPPLAIVIAFVWLGELPAPLTLVGGVLTLGGVVLFNRLGVERT